MTALRYCTVGGCDAAPDPKTGRCDMHREGEGDTSVATFEVTTSFAESVDRAERVALTWSHPAAELVRVRWNAMDARQRAWGDNDAEYARLVCKLGPDGPCRCGQHNYQH